MIYPISSADLERVEALLKEDIRWTIMEGPGWDPANGAFFENGKWTLNEGVGDVCGVCAIGALLCRRQPLNPFAEYASWFQNVECATSILNVPRDWVSELYFAVYELADGDESLDRRAPQVEALAIRLNAFADEVKAKHEAAK